MQRNAQPYPPAEPAGRLPSSEPEAPGADDRHLREDDEPKDPLLTLQCSRIGPAAPHETVISPPTTASSGQARATMLAGNRRVIGRGAIGLGCGGMPGWFRWLPFDRGGKSSAAGYGSRR